jgi:hypothetical protein
MPRRTAAIHAVIAAIILASLACQAPIGEGTQPPSQADNPAAFDTSVAGTVAAVSTQTAQAAGGGAQGDTTQTPAQVTDTPAPTVTPTIILTPTETLTPTPSAPTAYLTENTNCRKGPLVAYDLVATYLTGKVLNILGKNAAGDYVFVIDPEPPGKQCWLWTRYVQVTGSVAGIPVFTPPPTPTPSYDWTANWTVWINGSPGTMNITQTGSSIGGTLTAGAISYDISGSVSDGGRKASGQAKQAGVVEAEYNWTMQDNMDQFRGSYTTPGGSSGSWCGARDGAGMPSPCS